MNNFYFYIFTNSSKVYCQNVKFLFKEDKAFFTSYFSFIYLFLRKYYCYQMKSRVISEKASSISSNHAQNKSSLRNKF